MPVDALSQPSDDEREVKDQQLSLIPPETFLNIADADCNAPSWVLDIQHGCGVLLNKQRFLG